MLRFKIICCILIFICVPKLNAQVYAPDTIFHFQHPKFNTYLRYVQTLNNADYWIGYYNPVMEYNTLQFSKFNNEKEVFLLDKPIIQIFYLGENNVLFESKSTEKIIVDGQNNIVALNGIKGSIVHVDTLHKHIYCVNDSILNRYSYSQELDTTFHWKGKNVKDNLITAVDGKIYHKGTRYFSDGSLDSTFHALDIPYEDKEIFPNHESVQIVQLKKIWNTYILYMGSCYVGCNIEEYHWNEFENQPVKYVPTGLNNSYSEFDYYDYNLSYRDSLFLKSKTKILPNLIKDTSFVVNGEVNKVYLFYYGQPIAINKYVDILPNHDLLGIYNNQLYRFSTKNNVWVEFENLPEKIMLNDSILNNGLEFEVYSSDGSDVELDFYSAEGAKLIGKKIFFTENTETVTIKAKSKKGGQVFEKSVYAYFPILPTSTFSYTPLNPYLDVDFKPFQFKCIVNNDTTIPLTIHFRSEAAFYKDGWVYPTGKGGEIEIDVEHSRTKKYEASRVYIHYYVNKLPQEVYHTGLKETQFGPIYYNLVSSRFPFKMPISVSSQKTIKYNLETSKFRYGTAIENLFEMREDSLFLNPAYLSILRMYQDSKVGTQITVVIQGTQDGTERYQPISFNIEVIFNYYEELLNIPFFKIFPNPVPSYLYIVSPINQPIESIKLYNLEGKLIKIIYGTERKPVDGMKYILNDTGKVSSYFETDNLENGYYLVEFMNDNKIYRQKIIKE